MFHFSLYST